MKETFLDHFHYIKGDYTHDNEGYKKLSKEINTFENEASDCDSLELSNPSVIINIYVCIYIFRRIDYFILLFLLLFFIKFQRE